MHCTRKAQLPQKKSQQQSTEKCRNNAVKPPQAEKVTNTSVRNWHYEFQTYPKESTDAIFSGM